MEENRKREEKRSMNGMDEWKEEIQNKGEEGVSKERREKKRK